MGLSDLFSHLNSLTGSYNTHWNFYSAVVLGLLALIATVKRDEKNT